jgi:hypothetical protein
MCHNFFKTVVILIVSILSVSLLIVWIIFIYFETRSFILCFCWKNDWSLFGPLVGSMKQKLDWHLLHSEDKKNRKKISSTLEKYLTSKSRVSLNQKKVLVFSPSRLILCNKRNVFISENYNFESQKAKKSWCI